MTLLNLRADEALALHSGLPLIPGFPPLIRSVHAKLEAVVAPRPVLIQGQLDIYGREA